MEISGAVGTEKRVSVPRGHEIDWDAYASQYDLLATNNPSYWENIESLRELVETLHLPDDAAICDVGAGTGNYICAVARDLPNARFVHIDADPMMNQIASEKYRTAGIRHVELHCVSATEAAYPAEAFDLIICINALYSMHPQEAVLRKIKHWLKPSGTLFIIDFGRRTKILDWAGHILGHIYREKGLRECVRFLRNSAESLRQNRRGSRGQADGTYWLHTTTEFGDALRRAGFEVNELRSCYRGYCDLAVCRPRNP